MQLLPWNELPLITQINWKFKHDLHSWCAVSLSSVQFYFSFQGWISPREPFHLACQLPISNNVQGKHRAECKAWQSIMIAFPFKDAIPILCLCVTSEEGEQSKEGFYWLITLKCLEISQWYFCWVWEEGEVDLPWKIIIFLRGRCIFLCK